MATPQQVAKMKSWIDDASYETLLLRWRFAPVGSPWFQGEVGEYYRRVMSEKEAAVGEDAACLASKNVSWS